MRCKIADLIVEIPAAGGMAPRCEAYLYDGPEAPDITIRLERYRPHLYPGQGEQTVAYMESGAQFCYALRKFDGFYLHASAVVLDGRAYLFSGHSTAGKSTHARLWQQVFGEKAVIINDDKPALRCIDGVWYAYGTPWCGKDGINTNARAPVAGVCFMKKAPENKIRRLSTLEALRRVMTQTFHQFDDAKELDLFVKNIGRFLEEIPVFELENRPEPAAALLSHATMSRREEEIK